MECAESAKKTNSSPFVWDCACAAIFGAGKARKSSGPGEVTVREQQGRWVKHENGEGRTERKNMHCKTPFLRHLSQRVSVLSVRHAEKMCVRQQGVHTPRRTHGSRYYLGVKPSEVFSPIPSWTFRPGMIFHQLFYNEAHSSEEAARFQVAGLSSNS